MRSGASSRRDCQRGRHDQPSDQFKCDVGVTAVGALLLLAACAAGPNELVDTGPDPAGFWLGLWQGLISPIIFIVSLFTTKVNIYEVQNNGNWYDAGFMLGLVEVDRILQQRVKRP